MALLLLKVLGAKTMPPEVPGSKVSFTSTS